MYYIRLRNGRVRGPAWVLEPVPRKYKTSHRMHYHLQDFKLDFDFLRDMCFKTAFYV